MKYLRLDISWRVISTRFYCHSLWLGAGGMKHQSYPSPRQNEPKRNKIVRRLISQILESKMINNWRKTKIFKIMRVHLNLLSRQVLLIVFTGRFYKSSLFKDFIISLLKRWPSSSECLSVHQILFVNPEKRETLRILLNCKL